MAFFEWVRWLRHPAKDFFVHVPNEVMRKRPGKALLIKRYRLGVRAGYPDIICDYPSKGYAGLRAEIKVGSNTASAEQIAWIERLNSVGYCARVVNGLDSLIALVKQYLEIT